MGTCISKCRPKTAAHKGCNLVEDKLVISQAPATPYVTLPNKQSNFPLSPSSSSFSCSTTVTTSSCCSSSTPSSSYSSSALSAKDRSFSNEFLWSCLKENPQVIPVESIILSPVKSLPVKLPPRKLQSSSKSIVAPSKQLLPPRHNGSQPLKRELDCSPALVRQKSFRKEPERPQSPSSIPRRKFNSPSSPSRSQRFNGDNMGRAVLKNSTRECCKREVTSKNNAVNPNSLSARKENLRPRSPLNNLNRDSFCSRKTETCVHRIHPGVDQNKAEELIFNQGINSPAMDDIDNPLISLDCFIFL